LGTGSFDTYRFVKLLKDKGYQGKIGLQCYNIKMDVSTALSLSLNTWNGYKNKYSASLKEN